MKSIQSILLKISIFGLFAYLCQACPVGGCSLPHGMLETSKSFVLGYRGVIGSLELSGTNYKKQILTYEICESIFENYLPFDQYSPIGSQDSFAINLEFVSESSSTFEHEDRHSSKGTAKALSETYTDVNFNRLVSAYTVVKGVKNGRIVISESVKAIHVIAHEDYAHYKSGDLLDDAFALAYTDPLGVAQKNSSFDPEHSGSDYIFVPFLGHECDIQGEKTRFDKEKNMYKTRQPAPFQWYDGEYFPCVQYQNLSEVNFAEIPHISAMVALIPKVFPTVPGDYSFTIEVEFTNGKILRSTTPPIGFSGL